MLNVFGLALVILGALVTFTGEKVFEHFNKAELTTRQMLAIKLIGLFIVVAGAILVFQFGGKV